MIPCLPPGKKFSAISISIIGYCFDGSISRESEKSRHDWYPKLSIVQKVITFFGWLPVLAPSVWTGLATHPLVFVVEFVGLAMWKQLTRWPTSGFFITREDKNLCTSSFLQRVSLWYNALAVIAEIENEIMIILFDTK